MKDGKPAKNSRTKFIILILFIVLAFTAIRFFVPVTYLDEEKLRQLISSAGLWGPVVYILIYSVAPSLLLPGLPLTIAGGVLFGPVWGVVYTSVGATIGSGLAFLVARHMGRGWVESLLKKGSKIEELDRRVQKEGWKVVALTRLIPLFPFNLLNFAFGLTKIKFTIYLAASFIFMLPGIIAYVVFSSSLLDILKGNVSKKFLAGLVLVVLVSVIPIIYRKHSRK